MTRQVEHELSKADRAIHSAGYRLNQGNLLAQVGRKAEARRRFLEAWQIALAIGADDVLVRVAYTLADFELFAGRMADARRWLQSFEDERNRERNDREHHDRVACFVCPDPAEKRQVGTEADDRAEDCQV